MASIKDDTLKSVKWTSVEKFALQGMHFVMGIIMARLLSPSDYGTVGMLSIFLAISSTFIDSGFGNALTRKLDRTEVDYSTIFFFNVFVAIAFYLTLFLIAPWVADFFKLPILCPILRVQAISLILNSFIQVQITKLIVNLDFKALATRSLLASGLSGVIGIFLAYKGFGVWALVYQGLLSTIITVFFIVFYCRWIPLFVFSKRSFIELGSYGGKLLASSLLHTIYMQLTTIIIGRYFSAKDLGYYKRGTSYAELPVNTFNSIIGRVAFPIMAKLQNDDNHLLSVYRKYICTASLLIFWGCMFLAANAKPLIIILITEKWAPAIIYLQLYAFCIMFRHINSINLTLLQVKGRSDLFLRLEIFKKTISIAMLFASIPFGVIGICISRILYAQIAIIFNTYYTGKNYGIGYFTQIKDFSVYFIYSFLACLPAYIFNYFDKSLYWGLGFGLISCPVLYYLLISKDTYFLGIKQIVIDKINNLTSK